MPPPATNAFTLVEVMVAVGILGLCLVSLFAGEIGAVKVATRARNTSIGTLLARCKMAEIEEKVMREGLPAVSAEDSDHCCEDGEVDGFTCDWKIERIVLPDAMANGDQQNGPLGQLAGAAQNGPGATPGAAGAGGDPLHGANLESLMGGTTGTGQSGGGLGGGLSSLAISFTYPVMKPTIEEQVRRVTVKVKWHEGSREHSFDVVQYFVADASSIPGMQDMLNGAAPPGTPGAPGTPGVPGTTTGPGAMQGGFGLTNTPMIQR